MEMYWNCIYCWIRSTHEIIFKILNVTQKLFIFIKKMSVFDKVEDVYKGYKCEKCNKCLSKGKELCKTCSNTLCIKCFCEDKIEACCICEYEECGKCSTMDYSQLLNTENNVMCKKCAFVAIDEYVKKNLIL